MGCVASTLGTMMVFVSWSLSSIQFQSPSNRGEVSKKCSEDGIFDVFSSGVQACGTSIKMKDPSRYFVLFYTVALGATYHRHASSWCEAVSRNVLEKLPEKWVHSKPSASFVFSDAEIISSCPHVFTVHNKIDLSKGAGPELQYMKMLIMPMISEYYVYLDADARPTLNAWKFVHFLNDERVKIPSFALTSRLSALSPRSRIGMTKKARAPRENSTLYNTDIMVHTGNRTCMNIWEHEVMRLLETIPNLAVNERRRYYKREEQRALYMTTQKDKSCKVIPLPLRTMVHTLPGDWYWPSILKSRWFFHLSEGSQSKSEEYFRLGRMVGAF